MSTAGFFDNVAGLYDSWYERNPVTAANEVDLVREAVSGGPRPCLEVGVGTGFFASAVGCRYGVDPSRGMLELARMRGVEVAVGRAERLPIVSGSLGTVLIVVSICFMDDPWAGLREAHRVLRSGGWLVACIVPRESPLGYYYYYRGLEGDIFYSRARFIRMEELIGEAVRIGFDPVWIKGTVSYMPYGVARREKPRRYTGREGFACVRLVKRR